MSGSFITTDRYEGQESDPGSLHLRVFARSNPIKYVDPSGNSFIGERAVGRMGAGLSVGLHFDERSPQGGDPRYDPAERAGRAQALLAHHEHAAGAGLAAVAGAGLPAQRGQHPPRLRARGRGRRDAVVGPASEPDLRTAAGHGLDSRSRCHREAAIRRAGRSPSATTRTSRDGPHTSTRPACVRRPSWCSMSMCRLAIRRRASMRSRCCGAGRRCCAEIWRMVRRT